MMRGLIKSSMTLRFIVVIIAALLIFAGIYRFRQMSVDILPEFSPPYVEIQTESLGLSADEVEQLITVPMEQDLLNGTPWVDTIRSDSVPGLSSIVITFKSGTDLMKARQMVSERMTQAVALPHVSKPPTMLQPLSSSGRVMIIGLTSKTLSLIQMGELARWTIGPKLMGVPGVASVAVWGQRDRQLQVLIDPVRLQTQKIAIQDVLESAGNALWVSTLSWVEASTPGTGGFIETPNQRLGVFHLSPIVTADSLAQVPISDYKKADGTPLVLSDVANVVEDHQPLIGDAVTNTDAGLLMVVEKFPGSNTLEVTRGLQDALTSMQPGLPNLNIDSTLYQPASFVDASLGNLGLALLLGGLFLVVLLGIFYWNWRLAVISTVAIGVSLATAAVIISFSGATINIMVLGGLLMAIGVLVDDTIIDVENIMRRLRQSRQAGSTQSAGFIIIEAMSEMRSPMFFAIVIIVMAVSPIFFIQGTAGAFFQPLAFSYVAALIASVLVSLMVTPALCFILLQNAAHEPSISPVVAWMQSVYGRTLARAIQRPRLIYPVFTCIVLAGFIALPFLNVALIPPFKERDLLIELTGMPGISQPEMSRIATRVSNELHATKGVHDVGALIGRAVLGDQVVNVNSAQVWVSIDPVANYDDTLSAIREEVNGYPGVKSNIQTYLQDASRSVLTTSNNTITVRLYGDVEDILKTNAAAIQKAVSGVKGIIASHINLPVEQLTVETEVNIVAAQRYDLKPGDVRRAAAALLAGIQVGSLFEEQKIFDVVVWSTPETRQSLTSISNLLIDTPTGEKVRLGDVATVRIVPTPADIQHEAAKRYMDVVVSVQGRSLASVAADLQTTLLKMQFPLEYHAQVLGDFDAQQAAQSRLLVFSIVALIAIVFLLQAAYGSWRLAVLSTLTLPTALAGGALTTLLGGGTISIGTVVGFLAVFGISARNGMLLVNHYQNLQRNKGEPFGLELVLRGARERLAPILMTTLAAGFALLPMLFLGNIPGLEVARPMAVFIMGGLVMSTLLTLFILPATYLIFSIRPAKQLELATVAPASSMAMPASIMDLPDNSLAASSGSGGSAD